MALTKLNTRSLADNIITSAKLASNVISGPAFKAYKSAAQNGVAHNSTTKITFETEVYDTDNCYNTSISRSTPTTAASYHIIAQIELSRAVDENRVMGVLWKNGSTLSEGNNSSGNNNGVFPSSRSAWLVPCNGSSDYIEIAAYGSADGSSYNLAYDTTYRCTVEGQWVRDL